MVTLHDVARLAGVSTATVSRVVHGQDRVRESTRARVQQAIEELGYVPDGAAQSLSRRRKDVIGLVCVEREVDHIDIENVGLLYYDEVLRGVEACIRHRNWSLLITFMQGDRPDFSRLDSLTGKVDGILIGEGFVASSIIERLAARVPVVVIAGTPGERAADVVAADNFSGSAAIITHLIAGHGKRRLFHLDGPPNSPDAGERRRALEYMLRSPSRMPAGRLHAGHHERPQRRAGRGKPAGEIRYGAAGRGRVRQRSDGDRRPAGVRGQRRARPQDVAVVGFDDIALGSLYDPSLTTVHQPMRMLGERACALLLDRIADPGLSPAAELLPTELVLRASCGCSGEAAARQPVLPLRADRDGATPRKRPARRATLSATKA